MSVLYTLNDTVVCLCLQESNPHACLVFYWEPLNRQVRTMYISEVFSYGHLKNLAHIVYKYVAGLITASVNFVECLHQCNMTNKACPRATKLYPDPFCPPYTGVVVFLLRFALRELWSGSLTRAPVITSTLVPRAAKSVLW